MGRKLGLSLEDVLAAAAAVADAEGLDSLSLAAVAARLGVRSPSLYNHVDGLPGLRRLLAMRASDDLGRALRHAGDSVETPSARLKALCGAYRQFAREHPGLYASLLPAPSPRDDPEAAASALAPIRIVAGVVREVAPEPAEEVQVLRWLRSTLHGFVDLEMGGGFGLAESNDDSFDVLVEMITRALERAAPRP